MHHMACLEKGRYYQDSMLAVKGRKQMPLGPVTMLFPTEIHDKGLLASLCHPGALRCFFFCSLFSSLEGSKLLLQSLPT